MFGESSVTIIYNRLFSYINLIYEFLALYGYVN
nr:MAG TPA: hypothetical protein [Caudoviricetes sp.]DAQ24562.1 MAG TPA: hypothetical protein [Caudoviricetes sp.]